MAFFPEVVDELMVRSNRCCCLCHSYVGLHIEIHHIVPKAQGGTDDLDNGIPLCFECHAKVEAYNRDHPRGRKYQPAQLKRYRDGWFDMLSDGRVMVVDGHVTPVPAVHLQPASIRSIKPDSIAETSAVLASQIQNGDTENAGYIHDVFLGYRDDFIGPWVRKYFLPCFDWFLQDSIGRNPSIFIAKQGTPLSPILPSCQTALARSRCLVAIWSPSYFQSPWSMRECALMLHRMEQVEDEYPVSLIFPVVVSDGKYFPEFVRGIPQFDCRDFAIPASAFEKTVRYVAFHDNMREWVERVAATIRQAPPWRDAWLDEPVIAIPELAQLQCTLPTL